MCDMFGIGVTAKGVEWGVGKWMKDDTLISFRHMI